MNFLWQCNLRQAFLLNRLCFLSFNQPFISINWISSLFYSTLSKGKYRWDIIRRIFVFWSLAWATKFWMLQKRTRKPNFYYPSKFSLTYHWWNACCIFLIAAIHLFLRETFWISAERYSIITNIWLWACLSFV